MANAMIRRVARAIRDEQWAGAAGWAPDDSDAAWEIWEGRARAAIAAMSDPTPFMVAMVAVQVEEASDADREVALKAMALVPPTRHFEAPTILAELARDHRAMITAALMDVPAQEPVDA